MIRHFKQNTSITNLKSTIQFGYRVFALSVIFSFFVGCGAFKAKDDLIQTSRAYNSLGEKYEYLHNFERIKGIESAEVLQTLKEMGLPEIATKLIKLGSVEVYKIEYYTKDSDNKDLLVSGAVLVPSGKKKARLLSYFHETLYDSEFDQAPSYGNFEDLDAISLIASLGFFIVLPDHIGYGSSNSKSHKLMINELNDRMSLNMLRASKELIESELQLEIDDEEGIYLAGYSEGANLAMSLHKRLSNVAQNEFTVRFSSVGGGVYDLGDYISSVFQKQQYPKVNELMWIIESLRQHYNLAIDNDFILKPPYNIYTSELMGGDIELPLDLDLVFTPEFIEMIINEENIELLGIFASSNSLRFESSADIYIYHSKNDEVVPYDTALRAAKKLKEQGNSIVMLADKVSHEAGKRRFALMTALAYLKSRVEWEPLDQLLDILQPSLLNSNARAQKSLSSVDEVSSTITQSFDRNQILKRIDAVEAKLELQQTKP